MKTSKLICLLIVCLTLLALTPVYASVGYKANGTPHGARENLNATCPTGADCSTQTGLTLKLPVLDSSLFATGVANGGAVSVASTTTAVPTGYALVRKVIPTNSDPAFTAGTLADGKPGQILTIFVAGTSPNGNTTGSYTITPTTATGWSTFKFTAKKDFLTVQFIDTTTGWVVLQYGGSVTLTLT